MKIIVAGAGNVGNRLIKELAEEDHNIILIDTNADLVSTMIDTYDIMGVVGTCVSSEILTNAEVQTADLLIACTPYDEMNILTCIIAKKLGVNDTIARVRNPEYFSIFKENELGLTMFVNPEYQTAVEISRLLRYPAAMKIEPFAKGKVEVVAIKVNSGSPLIGLALKKLSHRFQLKMLVCAVERGEKVLIPSGDFVLEEGDDIYITASPKDITQLFKELGFSKGARKILIAGGDRVSYYLAKELQKSNISVKIIEDDETKCNLLEETLEKAEIILGDAGDQSILLEEGLTSSDAFVSLCESDEKNIILALYATGSGLKKVIAKVDNQKYTELVEGKGIESAVSVCNSTVNEIIRYVRGKANKGAGKFNKLYRIIDDQVELLEFSVSDGFEGKNIPIKDLYIKHDIVIAAIVRSSELIIPGGEDTIRVGDTVLLATTQDILGDLNDILE